MQVDSYLVDFSCFLLIVGNFISWYLSYLPTMKLQTKAIISACCTVGGLCSLCVILPNLSLLNFELFLATWLLFFVFKLVIKHKYGVVREALPIKVETLSYEEIVDKFSHALFMFHNGITGNKFELHKLMKEQEYFKEFDELVNTVSSSLKVMKFPNVKTQDEFVDSLVKVTYVLDKLTSDFLFEKDESVVLSSFEALYTSVAQVHFLGIISSSTVGDILKLEAKNPIQATMLADIKQSIESELK